MLGIELEKPSISNQICKKLSISKFCVWNTWYFDQNSGFWIEILGFSFEWLGFSFEICTAKTRKERVQLRTCTCHVTSYPLLRSCTHFGWPHTLCLRACNLDAPSLWEIIGCWKESPGNNKLFWKNFLKTFLKCLPVIIWDKKHLSKQVVPIT